MKLPKTSPATALCVAVMLFVCLGQSVLAQTFTETGFSTEVFATVKKFQTVGFTFAPDGRVFIWEKPGVVRIMKNGVILPQPFIDISTRVNQVGDRGLIGLALDPKFSTNGFVYLLYVYENLGNPADPAPKTARLTRVQTDPANPDSFLINSEVVLMGKIGSGPCGNFPVGSDCMGSDASAHTVGTVKFGIDGKIYVGMGDGGAFDFADPLSFRAQDLNTYNGKIMRINPDGTAPSDNPFFDGNVNSVKSKIYSFGLRSPYRFTHKPGTSEVYVGDVGNTQFEELNRGRGVNFGWPCYEGTTTNPAFQAAFPAQCAAIPASGITQPIHTYARGAGAAIVGGPFYTATNYPVKYRGSMFFADYVQGFIQRLAFDANNNISGVQSFATNVNSPVHIEQGPDGLLYYLSIASGEIRRVKFSGTAPSAAASSTPPSAASPYTVAFSSNGSSDPAGSTLTYQWDFGDATTSTVANPTHTYVTTGVKTFVVKLTVTNTQGLTATASVNVVVGSRPPVATITAPANGITPKAGDTVTFTGTVSDPDESLPATAMKWSVLLHHNTHIHPGVTATGASGSFVIENHAVAGETFFYEIVLTVTDSAGVTDVKRVNVNPVIAPPPVNLPPTVSLIAPANNSTVTVPASITLRANAADADGSISRVEFYQVGRLLNTDTTAPYEYTFTLGLPVTTSFTAKAYDNNGAVTTSTEVQVNGITEPPPPLTIPAPWLAKDVGNVGKVGNDSFSNGSFTLQGSGSDIGGTSDSFNYVSQTLQGDGQIIARVASIENTAAEAKAGVMIRESLAANSRYVMVRYKSNEHTASLHRNNPGEATITGLGDAQILQRWQRIVRRGNQFSTYQSADGTNWLLIETVTVNMPSSVLFGIVVTANNNSVLCKAVIDNVTVTATAVNSPPTVNLTAPANNSTFTAPATITLRANATDLDGSISKVEFYQGGTLINSDVSAPYEYTVSLGSVGTASFTARAYDNSGAVTSSSAVQVNVTKPVNGTGAGLKGEYFKKEDFKELKLTRIDPFIDFDWGKEKPDAALDKDHFSIRWTGFVQPRFSGTQTFYVTTTDTVRLWINGQLIINRTGNDLTENRSSITLNGGQKYAIKLEFVEKDKTASIKLEWSSPNQAREVIPRSQLYTQ